MRVKRVTKRPYNGIVYNIATPPYENYIANGVLVHNCYQNSEANGEHADLNKIYHLIGVLSDMEVFEVALGGGEPTFHPGFCKILENCRECNIVPNFTTFAVRNITECSDIKEAVLKYAGSFASSDIHPSNIADIKSWNNNEDVKCVLQIPLGAYEPRIIQKALDVARFLDVDFTLLGFKNAGRGRNCKKFDSSWILDYIKQNNINRFGADTLFVKKFHKQLKDLGVPKELVVGEEGRFSCYIDMVGSKFGESSYTDELIDFTNVDNLISLMHNRFPFVRRTP